MDHFLQTWGWALFFLIVWGGGALFFWLLFRGDFFED